MFIKVAISDTVFIKPINLQNDFYQEIMNEIHQKYCYRIIPNIGLCMGVFSINNIGDAEILNDDGSVYLSVNFILMIFKPFIGEVMDGIISSCDKNGLKISLQFFNDISIPFEELPSNTFWDETKKQYHWHYSEDHILPIELFEVVRFKVIRVILSESSSNSNIQNPPFSNQNMVLYPTTSNQNGFDIPFAIIASIKESGLGMLSWWPSDQ